MRQFPCTPLGWFRLGIEQPGASWLAYHTQQGSILSQAKDMERKHGFARPLFERAYIFAALLGRRSSSYRIEQEEKCSRLHAQKDKTTR